MDFLAKLGTIVITPLLAIGGFIGDFVYNKPIQYQEEENLGRCGNPASIRPTTLAGGGIGSTDTTIRLTSLVLQTSNIPAVMSNFGDCVNSVGYLTIEPGSATKQEFVSFTGITQNSDGTATLTGVQRGLAPVFPYTASTTYAKSHLGGSVVVASNPPQFYDAIFDYIDNATSSGASDAASSVKGLVEVATGLEAASTTPIGAGNTSAPLALTTIISTSSSVSSGNWVPISQSDGTLAIGFKYGSTSVLNYVNVGTTTWTKPPFLSALRVQLWGGGGSGARGDTAGDEVSGGGGGAYCERWFVASELSSTENVVVGAGGAAQTSDNNGVTGSTTHFGGRVFAYGGGGGMQAASGVVGGGGGGCSRPGSAGADGGFAGDNLSTSGTSSPSGSPNLITAFSGGGGSGPTNAANAIPGSPAVWGGAGGGGTLTATAQTATATSLYGGNGGAARSDTGVAGAGVQPGGGGGAGFAVNSGAGGAGKIVITEYY